MITATRFFLKIGWLIFLPNWELEKLRSVFCLLLDQPELLKYLWQGLNHISAEALMGKWRVYGGGSRESLT